MSALDDAIDFLDSTRAPDLRWELRHLREIRDWALANIGIDFAAGDRVKISEDLDCNNGWSGYREALQGGIAKVHDIDFNGSHGYWYAEAMLDREWSVGNFRGTTRYWSGPVDETPEGYEPPSAYDQEHYPEGHKHVFWIPVRHLNKVSELVGA